MTDFWELLANTVLNDQFRAKLFIAQTGKYTFDQSNFSVAIPAADYTALAALVSPADPTLPAVIRGRPLSLMGLGELLYSISFQQFRDLVSQLALDAKALGVKGDGRSPLFYAAVGALIVDAGVRSLFHQGFFDQAGFGSLAQGTDRADLQKLSDPQVAFAIDSAKLCAFLWSPRCHVRVFPYDGHTHPVANVPPSANPPVVVFKLP